MRVGIVGCGLISKLHIKHLLAQGHNIIGLADRNKNCAMEIAESFRLSSGVYEDTSELIESKRPDAIHILTPPKSHVHLTVESLKGGCHVLVEKPMALSVSEIDEMMDTAKKHGRVLTVGHTQHFVPVIQRAYRMFEQGDLGKILSAEVHIAVDPSPRLKDDQPQHWQDLPGGLCYDMAPHAIYLLLPYIGKVKNVFPIKRTTGLLPIKHDDEVQVQIEGTKAAGVVWISLNTKPPMSYLNIYGTKMSLRINFTNMILIRRGLRPIPKMLAKVFYHLDDCFQTVSGIVSTTGKVVTKKLKSGDEHGVLIRKFYESITLEGPPPVLPEEGRETAKVMETIWRTEKEEVT